MLRQADTSCTEVLVRGFAWSISLQHGLPYGSADVGMYLMCNVPPVMLGPGLKEGELPGIAAPHAKLEVFGGNAAGGAPCTLMSLKYTARRDSPYLGKGWGYAKVNLLPGLGEAAVSAAVTAADTVLESLAVAEGKGEGQQGQGEQEQQQAGMPSMAEEVEQALLAPWEQALVDGRVSGKITFYRYIN
ncbi:hypothetical protein CHLRE_01g022462v5 [Chlamydomonas reinhardtii]|uniref:Uncharacterized protein n=1 Tax=Chlamydomonas reinhardtii TaxID=3055 RepID=A0A2K3E653_CHLRE|nr:uncharacterized protein CHLRE_01g022462v5 [Chlamydomonas reinhardtii]PNW88279.1 hypothetical protein CHLRE_01g022462v5 [Chlamydomonas reinhardtii]